MIPNNMRMGVPRSIHLTNCSPELEARVSSAVCSRPSVVTSCSRLSTWPSMKPTSNATSEVSTRGRPELLAWISRTRSTVCFWSRNRAISFASRTCSAPEGSFTKNTPSIGSTNAAAIPWGRPVCSA